VRLLEQQVATVRPAPARIAQNTTPASSSCTHVFDDSVPRGTAFPYVVHFDLGAADLNGGNGLVVTEIRGTKPRFELGGMYVVRGRYTLASVGEAVVGFHLTAVRPGDGCTNGNGRDEQRVARGAGTFELAMRFTYVGRPRVTFYAHGQSEGGVYFGGGEFGSP